jgi:HEAT repeat protein
MSMQQPTPAAKPAKPPEPKPPVELRESAIATIDASGLLAIVTNASAPEFQKAKACQRLGELGAKEAVPALASLLPDERLSTYALYGLEPIADPSVDEALRAALPKLKGDQLIGVINSIGKRRDPKALPVLAKLLHGPDADFARAAAAAIGSIGGPPSARSFRRPSARPPAS